MDNSDKEIKERRGSENANEESDNPSPVINL